LNSIPTKWCEPAKHFWTQRRDVPPANAKWKHPGTGQMPRWSNQCMIEVRWPRANVQVLPFPRQVFGAVIPDSRLSFFQTGTPLLKTLGGTAGGWTPGFRYEVGPENSSLRHIVHQTMFTLLRASPRKALLFQFNRDLGQYRSGTAARCFEEKRIETVSGVTTPVQLSRSHPAGCLEQILAKPLSRMVHCV
jgi:hypothetical protein